MENEKIKKALECCTLGDCHPCAYGNIGAGCRDAMYCDALALIKKLEVDIEVLKKKRYLRYELHSVIDLASVLENERRDAINAVIDRVLKDAHHECRLDGVENYYCLTYNQIEQIAKDALGD